MTVYAISYADYLDDLRVWSYADQPTARAAGDGLPENRSLYVVESEADLLTELGHGPLIRDLFNKLTGSRVERFESIHVGLKRTFQELVSCAVPAPAAKEVSVVEVHAGETSIEVVKERTGRRGRASRFSSDQTITVLSEKNPKKVGTKAHEKFERYRDGMTVQQYLDDGGEMADLIWDSSEKRKFISVE